MAEDITQEVAIKEGRVVGKIEEGISIFKGIPYAEPPVGSLRWSPPVRKQSLGEKPLEAFAYGASPLQSRQGCIEGGGGDPGTMNEDCLFLNVWTPTLNETAKKPVIVWIFGGAFVVGTGCVPPYNGIPMAQKDVVLVTFNYRVGQLGFFAHPLLDKDGAPQAEANFGLMDQMMVLEWVQDNIAKFGGDPGNVTLVGQSAGGKSVLSHFCSPLNRGKNLFHRGIAQSVYVLNETSMEKARASGEQFTHDLVAVGLLKEQFTLEELRNVPGDEFWLHSPGTFNAPSPIVGDAVLSKSLRATFEDHEEQKLPLIMGSTSDDASVAAAFDMDAATVIQLLKNKGLYLSVKLLYSGANDTELARRVVLDFVFGITPKYFGDLHSSTANGSNHTWRYEFAYVAKGLTGQQPNGVPHGGDVPYFLGTCDRSPPTQAVFTDADRAFASQVLEYVVRFAHRGDPSPTEGGVAWPRHIKGSQDRLLLLTDSITAKSNYKPTIMAAAEKAVKDGAFDEMSKVPAIASLKPGETP
ncbi:carboxylesterase/lipase family protein [Stigmatella erecta]|uniref:Carboxylic ester hydrolase n=1 Tax=Stigmatella erecta TaxID=83460 RepID=A0A1I0LGJ8_9BACT|nr:carboxylesterase family protein [Stigmatella erecta]SEU38693.1 para-nitrobenzyl esterase [Stigmatella erecta]